MYIRIILKNSWIHFKLPNFQKKNNVLHILGAPGEPQRQVIWPKKLVSRLINGPIRNYKLCLVSFYSIKWPVSSRKVDGGWHDSTRSILTPLDTNWLPMTPFRTTLPHLTQPAILSTSQTDFLKSTPDTRMDALTDPPIELLITAKNCRIKSLNLFCPCIANHIHIVFKDLKIGFDFLSHIFSLLFIFSSGSFQPPDIISL